MVEQGQKRQIAVKTRVNDILKGRYVKEAGWMPNYILTEKGEKISRINLIGVIVTDPIVDISYRSILIDDGSGKISVRAFQENNLFDSLSLGDPVFVIGRPREYNGQVYIVPEIIKKIRNTKWIEVRKLELEKKEKDAPCQELQVSQAPQQIAVKSSRPKEVNPIDVTEESLGEDSKEKKEPDNSKKIYSIIKSLDQGNGADYEHVITESGLLEAERIISLLLKEGEIFEVSPGKLKVLE